jgi:hypothetical protein
LYIVSFHFLSNICGGANDGAGMDWMVKDGHLAISCETLDRAREIFARRNGP